MQNPMTITTERMIVPMDYWKTSGEQLCAMADQVLRRRMATDESCIEAVAQLREAARQRYLGAYPRLGRCFARGIGVAADETRAMEYYRMAADCGDEAAAQETVRLNPLYRPKKLSETDEGALLELKPEDDRTAAELLHAADAAAQSGDEAHANAWYRYAAKMGQPDAMYQYAKRLEADGQTDHAMRWYRRAARQSQADARAAMQRLDPLYRPELPNLDSLTGDQLYLLANDYAAEPELATRLHELAAAHNSGKAALVLAQERWAHGDYDGAVPHLRTAADAGLPAALDLLGQLAANGWGGTAQNAREAFRYYVRAAEGGDGDGCFHAGACCESGTGTSQHAARAAEWYAKGAALGNDAARERLQAVATPTAPTMIRYLGGHFFLYGDRNGAHRDFRLAFELLKSAADDQMPEACYDLGLMYRDGRYVYDKRKARAYLDKAAQFGVTGAAAARKKVYQKTIVYLRQMAKSLVILAVCLAAFLFVSHRLTAEKVVNPAAWPALPAVLMIALGCAGLMVKHYFIFRRTSVRPWYQNLLFPLICPGIPLAALAILAGCGVLERYAVGAALVVAAILTTFLVQHDSAVRDAIWVGLRLILFLVGAILLGQLIGPCAEAHSWAFWAKWSDTICIAALAACALAILVKQFYLYAGRLDLDAFLLNVLMCLLWPGVFLGGVFAFCWIALPNHGLLAVSAAVGTVLHCLISENIWGSRETD